MDAIIAPEGSLEFLSRQEVVQLSDASSGGLYELWRQCSLAVLNSGAEEDDVREILRRNRDFEIAVLQQPGGIEIQLKNAPDIAFVDGRMIRGLQEHLVAVLRDLLYAHDFVLKSEQFDLDTSNGITDAVFHILRNAGALGAETEAGLAVCWGGHAISREEYDYSKSVGYALGLRELDVCTGCGAGAMKGPMKGTALGHAKQRIQGGRYLGLTEPTIIGAEAPNAIVNQLVILPDMEKRLEAFLRMAHGIVVFPGGVGTAEEIIYLLGVLADQDNDGLDLPIVFTGPASSAPYFERLHAFISATLGPAAQSRYRIIMNDPTAVARTMAAEIKDRLAAQAAGVGTNYFNWSLNVDWDFQTPFVVTHQSMAALRLDFDQPASDLAVNLRRAFSGIVAGNVREAGIRMVEQHGPFHLRGEGKILRALDALLRDFVVQRRMRLTDPANYRPCFEIDI